MPVRAKTAAAVWVLVAVAVVFMCCPPLASSTPAADLDAHALLARIDDLWRADSSHGRMSMQVVTRHYRRTLEIEEWSRGTTMTLVRILAPARERGTATLKNGDVIYTWLPRTDRTIRLTASMMAGAWMGSHFTNDDLVKEYRLSEDYDPEVVSVTGGDGGRTALLRLAARPGAPVVWERIDIRVELGRVLPVSARYFGEDGRLGRTIFFENVRNLGGRVLPSRLRVVPADAPGERTVIDYLSLEFGVDLPESFFSVNRLRRR